MFSKRIAQFPKRGSINRAESMTDQRDRNSMSFLTRSCESFTLNLVGFVLKWREFCKISFSGKVEKGFKGF